MLPVMCYWLTWINEAELKRKLFLLNFLHLTGSLCRTKCSFLHAWTELYDLSAFETFYFVPIRLSRNLHQ